MNVGPVFVAVGNNAFENGEGTPAVVVVVVEENFQLQVGDESLAANNWRHG